MIRDIIFFHNDLDGIMSALFLALAKGKDFEFRVISHGCKNLDKLLQQYKDAKYEINIVDFVPNKIADFNIDHHKSNVSALKDMDESKFIFDPAAPSCAGLIARKFSLYDYKDIIERVDKVDSFGYESAQESIEITYDKIFDYLMLADTNINHSMNKALKTLKNIKSIDFFKRACQIIFGQQAIDKEMAKLNKQIKNTEKVIDKNVYKNFTFIQYERGELERNIAYVHGYDGIVAEEKNGAVYKISILLNAYKADKFEDIDASEICKKYGGGGHKMAAGFQKSKPLTFYEFKSLVDELGIK